MSLRSIILVKREYETCRWTNETRGEGMTEKWGRGETQKYENEEEIGRQITMDCMVALLCKV
jgi:hypothetical protein